MLSFPGLVRAKKLVCKFGLTGFLSTVVLAVAGGPLQTNGAAQEAGGAQAAAEPAPPPPVVFQGKFPSGELAFLNEFAGHRTEDVLKDKRFHNLMKRVIPNTEYHYGRDKPLWDAVDEVVGGSKQAIEVRDGRFVLVPGDKGPFLRGRGFLWFDMQEGIALGGFYFEPINGEPTPTLTIFSRQLKDTSLSMTQLPLDFAGDLIQWATREGIRPVEARYFIPENGRKYVLVHDEDYCDHPENAPAPPQSECQALNAEAADVDVNAAYFMKETHNQANATAWALGPDQVAWVGIREQTCGLTVACRIRITRALIGHS